MDEQQPEDNQANEEQNPQEKQDGEEEEIKESDQQEQPVVDEKPPEPEEDEETKKLRLEREEQERKEREEREELERIAKEEAAAKLKEEMAKFTELTRSGASNLGKTADGISYAYMKMNLAEKELERIFDSISAYKHIRYLDVSQNRIVDLSSVPSLKYLVQLNASKNEVNSLDIFADKDSFPYLQYLNLSGNKLKALEPISLPRLRRLNLIENEITTCESFAGHPNIEILELRKNKLKKTDGIANMPQLQELYLAENELNDFRSLTALPNLTRLNLRKNNFTKIKTPVPELPNLYHINLRENQLAKFDDFKKVLGDFQQQDFAQIAKIKNILSINMLANPIVDEMGEGYKQEILMFYTYLKKINKQDVNQEEIVEAARVLEERIQEQERKRQEEEEAKKQAEEEAKKAAEEAAAAIQNPENPENPENPANE